MREQFASYEIALALKELGFNKECLACYYPWSKEEQEFQFIDKTSSNSKCGFNSHFINSVAIRGCSTPLYQQVFDWFMKEHNILINVFQWGVKYYLNDELQTPRFLFDMETYGGYTDDFIYQSINDELKYESFYEAREQSILKAIEIIKNK